MSDCPHVYIAALAVQEELARVGVPKSQRNKEQGYDFRGIDDIQGAMASILAKHKLLILPQGQSRSVEQWQSAKGTVLFRTVIEMTYKLISGVDGSSDVVNVYGEAMDSGDKGGNKAQSSAYKVMAIQTFCIPTSDKSQDTESENHEIKAPISAPARQQETGDKPACPSCTMGKTAIIRNKYSGPPWVCYKDRGGCGTKFEAQGGISGNDTDPNQ